jgi:FkbM family methyltransferase
MENFITFGRIADHQRFYRDLIPPSALCFDIGANHGERSAALLALGARVVAVEPQAELAAFVASALKAAITCGNLTVLNIALGAEPGRARMFPATDLTRSMSTLSEVFVEASGRQGQPWGVETPVEVEVQTLDRLIDTYGRPDYCKIDVEGYDLEVLRGLSAPIDVVSFEYNTNPLLIGIAAECIEYLDGLGEYCFNYQVEVLGQQGLQLSEWVDGPVMRYILEHDIARQMCYGDIFSRRRRAAPTLPR